jgi:hypothetical protein
MKHYFLQNAVLFVFFQISVCFFLSDYRNVGQSRRDILSMGTGNVFGKLFRITTFGESHGRGVGVIVDGCPPRLPLSTEDIQRELNRRFGPISTQL